jgi:hypothetical protein
LSSAKDKKMGDKSPIKLNQNCEDPKAKDSKEIGKADNCLSITRHIFILSFQRFGGDCSPPNLF